VQLDADTEATGHASHLVTFDPRPEPKIEHDAQTKAQDFLGEPPEFVFDLLPGRLVPGSGAEGPEPFILRTALRSAASWLASVVLPAPGNPQVRISRATLTVSQSSSSGSWMSDHGLM
jgi:hypothetical protein